MIISILLYFSSFDEVSGDHKIGDDVIHENLYELKIKSSPPGLQIDGSGIYEEDLWVVTGIAQQKWGAYEFVGWTVDGKWVDGNPITVLMNNDHTVSGIYSLHPVKKQDSVNFLQENDNGSTFDLTIISPYGKTTGSGSYSDGDIVDFSVSEQYVYDEIYDGVRYAFSGWSDGYTPNLMSNFIKMTDSQTIKANWSKQYKLNISNSAQNKDIVNTSWHNENSTAPLVMNNFESKSDRHVKRTINEWISIGSHYAIIKDSKSPITSVLMNNPYTISIDWKNKFYLDVNSKYGKVEGSGFYDEGDVVIASIDSEMQSTGIAGTRLIFEGWRGDVNSDGINVQVIMNEPKSLEGVWGKQFQLTVNSEYGIPSGTGWYNEGDVATFGTNIPRDPAGLWQQNTFQGWSGDIETLSNTGSILMNGPKTVTANWNADYFIAFLNIGLISSTVIGGLLIYKKMKNGTKQEKSLPIKTKKQLLSRLTKELSTKINSKMNFSNNQETIQNNKLQEILEDIELQKEKMSQEKEQLEKSIAAVEIARKRVSEKTEQLEKSVAEVDLEKKKIAVELEKGLAEMELEKKKTKMVLENNLAEVELQKNNLSQKTEQLEKSVAEVDLEKKKIAVELEKGLAEMELEKKKTKMVLENNLAEVELQKNNLSQKTEQLEKSITEVDLEKKKIAGELERKVHAVELERKELEIKFVGKYGEVELQKNNLSQKTEQLEKSIAAVEIARKRVSEKTEQLENSITNIEFQKKKIAGELERKKARFEFERQSTLQRTEELKNKISKNEFEKKIAEVKLQKNIDAVEIARKRVSEKTEQLEKSVAEINLEKKNASQKTEQLEKSIAAVEIARKRVSEKTEQLEKSVAEVDLEKKNASQKTEQLEKSVAEVDLEKKNLSQKTGELEKILSKVEFQKKNLVIKTEELETKLTKIELEKKKLSSELERKESAIEIEKKRISQKAWDLEKRIGKFMLEMNISAIEIEKKRIAAELERKELVIELEKEHLSQRKKELEKSIAAVELEKDIAPTEIEIQKISKLDKKNIIAEIELARKISAVELERKESIIELEKKHLATKTEMLEKRISGIEIERKISSIQLERIESEIELEKKHLEQRKIEFGKNTTSRNTNLMKKDWDYSYSILDSEHNSYEKFWQWANVLEHELAIKETPDKENTQDVYLDDRK